jgi:hypothetical protein
VVLLSSRRGETVFQMRVARELPLRDGPALSEDSPLIKVVEHENSRS